jgi:NlpC/P60 family putative phage cell wall peptidase
MRAAALAAARGWVGTPYRHQASLRGEGADCLGLIRGVWRELVGPEPEVLPSYSPDWAEAGGAETLLLAARRWLIEIEPEAAQPGDVLLFRMRADVPIKHCGILGAAGPPEPRLIHAYWGRSVIESWMGDWWLRKQAAAFTWPGPTI